MAHNKKTLAQIQEQITERTHRGIDYINNNAPMYIQCSLRHPNSKKQNRLSMNINIICIGGQNPLKFTTNLVAKRFRYEYANSIKSNKSWIGYSDALAGYDDDSKHNYHAGKIRTRYNMQYYIPSKIIPLTTASLWIDESDQFQTLIQWNKHTWHIPLTEIDATEEYKKGQNFFAQGELRIEEEWM